MTNGKETSDDHIASLFKAFYRELCLFACQFVDDRDTAEDIVQDVFVNCLTQNVNLESIHNPRAYLYRAVRNACLKHLKKRTLVYQTEELIPDSAEPYDNIERSMIEVERRIEIYRAIDTLPHQCKRIFVRCQIDKLKYRETAEELDISINSVKTQMKKAVRLLKVALKDVYSLYISLMFAIICLA